MENFKLIYVNPTRRDLLKQLAVLGVGCTSVSLHSAVLHTGEIEARKGSLSGEALWREEASYEDLRRSMLWKFNCPPRYPDVIVRATSEIEIRNALQFAKSNSLKVVCRSSGHNTAGAVMRNGGMMLDVSSLQEISVEPENMTVDVQPGARMFQLAEKLDKHGLGFPTAACHTVALGGYILGGGLGAHGKHWGEGPACYSVLAADVILASGEKITVGKDEHRDIYWALCGIGPSFFGVVTRYKLRVYHQPGNILQSSYLYPLDSLPRLIELFADNQHLKNKMLDTSISLMNHPEQPEEVVVRVDLTAYSDKGPDSESQAEALLLGYREKGLSEGAIQVNENTPKKLSELMFTPNRSARTNTDNIFTDDPAAILAVVELFNSKPKDTHLSISIMLNLQMHTLKKEMSYSSSGAHYVTSHLSWFDGKSDEASRDWFSEFNRVLDPYRVSHYVNEVDNEQHPEKIRNCFSEENWLRLNQVRKRNDPDALFYDYLGYES